MNPVDLRSDTVTKPSPAMRKAMAEADVGDDVYGEDPSVIALEARVAEILGKERALFVPSGTMANQIALMLHCRPGESVVVGEGSHCMVYESGAAAAWAGVQFSVAGHGGLFDADELAAAVIPDIMHAPRSKLVVVENTHNRSGGRVFSESRVREIARVARARGLWVHIDGARLWNAEAATGTTPAEFARHADSVSVCFSKGLGAPVGSAIAGSSPLIAEARRLRKMLGGGMRQVGVLAAAAAYALEHQRRRLADDHRLAVRLAEGLRDVPGLSIDLASVETNIVNIDVDGRSAADFVQRAREFGVLLNAMGIARVRAVTHLDVDAAGIERAITALARA